MQYHYNFRCVLTCFIIGINLLKNLTVISVEIDYICPCPDENYTPPILKIPGTIQAEDFIIGGQGVAYYNVPTTGPGVPEDESALRVSDIEILCLESAPIDYACTEAEDIGDLPTAIVGVGYSEPGEWMRYMMDVSESGYYTISYSISRGTEASPCTLFILLNELIGAAETFCADNEALKQGEYSEIFPADGEEINWDNFYSKEAEMPFYLTEGPQYIILCINDQNVNIDSFSLQLYDATGAPTLTPTPVPTVFGTSDPTAILPTLGPTDLFTHAPTVFGTPNPTAILPTLGPTDLFTHAPTVFGTLNPTAILPTLGPTDLFTHAPTVFETPNPTAILPTLGPTDLFTHAPTVFETPNPTAILPTLGPTDLFTHAPTVFETPNPTAILPTQGPTDLFTHAPTVFGTPNPTPATSAIQTPVPTATLTPSPSTESNNDINIYTIRFMSTLFDQVTWNSVQLDDIFISTVENISCASNQCTVLIDDVTEKKLSMISTTTDRKLQTVDAVQISYQLQHVSGTSNAISVQDSLIEASENGDFLQAIYESSSSNLVTATSILTEAIGEPEEEVAPENNSKSSVETYLWLIICSVIIFVLAVAGIVVYTILKKKARIERATEEQHEYVSSAVEEITPRKFERISSDSCLEDSDVAVVSVESIEAPREGSEVVFSHLPYANRAHEICDELIKFFPVTNPLSNNNYQRIVLWANNMKAIFVSVHEYSKARPRIKLMVNMTDMNQCIQLLSELLYLTNDYHKRLILAEFATSIKLQSLVEESSASLSRAIYMLELGLPLASTRINFRIDENVSVLFSAVDNDDVNLGDMISALVEMSKEKDEKIDSKTPTDTSSNISAECGEKVPGWTNELCENVPIALHKLQFPINTMKIIEPKPIGVGRYAMVYKVEHNETIRAAKVVNLADFSAAQLQAVYLEYSRELYTLSLLQSPRLATICGCIASLTELTILLEYAEKRSLRNVLDEMDDWLVITPTKRHRILCDVVEGMAYLHSVEVYHRDLKSSNVLITGDFRAKLSDFSLEKTMTCVSSFTNITNVNQELMETSLRMPLECLSRPDMPVPGEKHDVYCYGIITFEVLSGLSGPTASNPWKNLSDSEISIAVRNNEWPKLPQGWAVPLNVYDAINHGKVMTKCLNQDPSARPSFHQILHNLTQF